MQIEVIIKIYCCLLFNVSTVRKGSEGLALIIYT